MNDVCVSGFLSSWALTHPQPEAKEGTQKIIIKTPDFLDMVPWYSGYVTFTYPTLPCRAFVFSL